MKRLIPLFVGLSLVSCDTGTKHTEGTSSETQTALQALADNAAAIAGRLPSSEQDPVVAGRTVSVDEDSTLHVIRELWCAGSSESLYGGFQGAVYLNWSSAGVGPDGERSSCSLEESIHDTREFIVDSLGRSDFHTVLRQYDGLERRVYQGSGIWDLRSGLTLIYRSLFADISTRKAVFRQEIELLGSCKLKLDFEDSATDTGSTVTAIDVPVVCGGRMIGRFLWDRVGLPRVLDPQGDLVLPRRILPVRFPEDTLGLGATVVGVQESAGDGVARLRVEVRMRFVEWDTLAVARWIKLPGFDATGRILDSVAWSGHPVDTLEFRVSSADLEGLRGPNRPVLVAPFENNKGAAWSNPLRL